MEYNEHNGESFIGKRGSFLSIIRTNANRDQSGVLNLTHLLPTREASFQQFSHVQSIKNIMQLPLPSKILRIIGKFYSYSSLLLPSTHVFIILFP